MQDGRGSDRMSTLNLVESIQQAVENVVSDKLSNFETCLPATIKNVRSDGRIDVVCDIRKMVTNGIVNKSDSIVYGIPLMQSGFGNFCIEYELSAGDSVLLLFFSRDALEWKKRKWSVSDPKNHLANNLNSCVAVPFVKEKSKDSLIKLYKNGIVEVKNKKCSFTIKDNGTIEFDAEKVTMKCPLVCEKQVISRVDFFAGATDGVGVSLMNTHTHTTAVGVSSQAMTLPNPNPEPIVS